VKYEHFLFRLTLIACLGCFVELAWAQTPAPVGAVPANAITTSAGGIQITFVPGSVPQLTVASTSADTVSGIAVPAALAVAITPALRYVDKHGKDIDPKSIKPTERLQPLYDSGPGGLVLQTVMVDRD
jgi:hypothetical protein